MQFLSLVHCSSYISYRKRPAHTVLCHTVGCSTQCISAPPAAGAAYLLVAPPNRINPSRHMQCSACNAVRAHALSETTEGPQDTPHIKVSHGARHVRPSGAHVIVI